jgi:ABC-type antimicrobial peptide transport system permease subunit
MTNLLQDLQFALQMMRKQLVIAGLALLALMLGIGASTRIADGFHIFNAPMIGALAERWNPMLLSLISAVAVALLVIGIYSVITCFVMPGTHKIGQQMALGAKSSAVAKMILWQGLKLALLGTVIGLFAAVLLTLWLQIGLFSARAVNPAISILITTFIGLHP